jgi:hypothetical protein
MTEICVYEIGLSSGSDTFSGQPNQRFECLVACLRIIKLWIDLFLSIPPSDYIGFPACMFTKMTRCFIDLWRLQTFEHPEWDRSLVLETIDVSTVLTETATKSMQVKDAVGLDRGGSQDLDFFSVFASKLTSMKVWWDALNTSLTDSFNAPAMEEWTDFPAELFDTLQW